MSLTAVIIALVAFGLWSLACLVLGAALALHIRSGGSILPSFNERRVFRMLTGREAPPDPPARACNPDADVPSNEDRDPPPLGFSL